MNQPTLDEIFDSRKIMNSNIDINKLEQIYLETSQQKNQNNSDSINKRLNTAQIESLMNQHFNYNLVYDNIEHGKKEADPFSFVDDLLKTKKI